MILRIVLIFSLSIAVVANASWMQLPGPSNAVVESASPTYTFYLEFEGSDNGTTYTLGGNDYSASGVTSGTHNSDSEVTTCPVGFGSGNCLHIVDGYDYLAFSVAAADLNTNLFTIEFDVYLSSFDTGRRMFVITDGSSNTLELFFDDDEVEWVITGLAGEASITDTYATGTAYHVVAKLNSSTDEHYVTDGTNADTSTSTLPTYNTVSTLWVGGFDGNNPSEFYIDNFKVYNEWID